jgi:hypothetical protein
MSQSWFSGTRRADATGSDVSTGEATDPAGDHPADAPEGMTSRSWRGLAVRVVLAALALGWIGLVGWSFVDPAIGLRVAPLLDIVIRLSAPLVLLVGLALLAMLIAGRWDNEGTSERQQAEAMDKSLSQTALAAARLAEVHAQLLAQARAYAADADRSAAALLDAAQSMTARETRLAQATDASVAALGALSERMAAFENAAPQLEQRLSRLTETLAVLGAELGERSMHLEGRFRDAAGAAEEARRQLVEASKSLDGRLGSLRDNTRAAGEELAGLSELSSARIDLTLDRVRTVLDTTEKRIEAQNDALRQLVDQSRDGIEVTARQSIERFTGHCEAIGETIDMLDARIAHQSEKSRAWLEAAAAGVKTLAAQFDALEQSALGRTEKLGTAMMELSGETRRLTDALAAGDNSSEQLVKRAESLLLALDSGIRELDESLPAAIDRVEERLAGMRRRIGEAGPSIESVEAIAAGVVSQLEASEKVAAAHGARLDDAMARAQTALAGQKEQVEALAAAIVSASESIAQLDAQTGPHMVETLLRVRETADAAARHAREAVFSVIPAAAASLGAASEAALREAVGASVDAQIDRLTKTSDHAVMVARDAAGSLEAQLKALDEASDMLERRIADSTGRIAGQEREMLSRRSAEIIEMLNSRAIDVSKWLSHDISQGEWTAYLKGDQGIFARRAVRMLDRTDTRAIHALYRDETDFAEHVNRYVHDFETLLRAVLDTADGSALAVTMLSSDIGKLYVALAQAMDRLKAN